MKRNKPEAELAALKAALDSPDERIKARLLGGFRDTIFGFEANREIHKRIRFLVESAKPIPTSPIMAQDVALSDVARTMISQPSMTPINTMEDAEALLDTLRTYENGRVLFNTLQMTTEEMEKETPSLDDVVTAMENTITVVRSKDQQEALFHFGKGDNTEEVFQRIMNPNLQQVFVPTGFRGFDEVAGGLARYNLQIVACHRKGGKSILCLNEGLNMYQLGLSGCIITLEMGEEEYGGRLLSNISGIPYSKIRLKKTSRAESARITQAYQNFVQHGLTNNCRLTVWPTMSLSLSEIGLLLKPYGFDFVIIDYLNLLRYDGSPDTPKHQILNDQARDCKQLTGLLNCPVIAATQTDVTSGNIRYSRAIEEHADYVWTWTYGESEEATGVVEIGQMVSRHTERFSFKVRADYERMRMTDYVEMPSQQEQVNDTEATLDFMDELR